MAVLLYNQSNYNLLEAALPPVRITELGKTAGYSAIALCDEQGLFAVPEFVKSCRKAGIKAIIGLKLAFDYQGWAINCCLYAKNDDGYRQLMYLSTQASEGKKLFFDDLVTAKDKLVVVVLPDSPYFYENLVDKNVVPYQEKLRELLRITVFYLGLRQATGQFARQNNDFVREVAQSLAINCVALPLVKVAEAKDVQLLKVLKAIKLQCDLKNPDLTVENDCYFLQPGDLSRYYTEKEIANTELIAQSCNVTFTYEKAQLPNYENKTGESSESFLRSLCRKGLAKRLTGRVPQEYAQRLDSELDIITKMGFENYFLLVYDFIFYAKKNDIPIGPGRGSAAGSLVAYCLGITNVDPMKYQLLFERFLNPERVSLPDIDTDIADTGRDQVVKYLFDKFDNYRCGHILTFGTFKAKQAIRDVAKVYGLPLPVVDDLCKAIPFTIKDDLAAIYANNANFRNKINSDKLHGEIFAMAQSLEFFPRHLSTHAGGIVLCNQPIYNYVPLTIVNGLVTTQFTMGYLEEFGLIKMDLLGLRNLTIIDEIVKRVGLSDPDSWPLDNEKVYELLRSTATLGVFQLESTGMRNTLKKLIPQNFGDIVAAIALFRPGPMQFIDQFVANRTNPEAIDYGHPDLIPILKPTSGIMVYQEQIMQVVQTIAGFSLGKADLLRKAISKKNETELLAQRQDFIAGCLSKGYNQETAEKIFAMIEKFANYGFNKAHSVAYAMIAYQCAYLKVNYPLAFYQALLNSVINVEDKLAEYLSEARGAGIKILPPSVNYSGAQFTIENEGLRFPLTAIKSVGMVAINGILAAKEQAGKFKDFYDYCLYVGKINSAMKISESLIKVGALDEFGYSRKTLLAALEQTLKYGALLWKNNLQEALSPELVGQPALIIMEDDPLENLQNEGKYLGLYFSKHPSDLLKEKHRDLKVLSDLKQSSGKVAAVITKLKRYTAKNGAEMAFITLEDSSGNLDAAVLPNEYTSFRNILQINALGIFQLEYTEKRGGYRLVDMRKE